MYKSTHLQVEVEGHADEADLAPAGVRRLLHRRHAVQVGGKLRWGRAGQWMRQGVGGGGTGQGNAGPGLLLLAAARQAPPPPWHPPMLVPWPPASRCAAAPPHLRGDDAALALVPQHPVHQRRLHHALARGAPRRQHVGGVGHEEADALAPCAPRGAAGGVSGQRGRYRRLGGREHKRCSTQAPGRHSPAPCICQRMRSRAARRGAAPRRTQRLKHLAVKHLAVHRVLINLPVACAGG